MEFTPFNILSAKLEKQLKARWAIEELIEDQLNSYQAHYKRAMVPTRLKDVAQVVKPNRVPPHELAVLGLLIIEIKIEEALIDEEMAEIQPLVCCIFTFGPIKSPRSSHTQALEFLRAKFKKIHELLTKAQKLRSTLLTSYYHD
ncbi:hypothetical protein ACH5RR_008202 [Cinchona calisaya]|uniref:Uncharacterized protein n=1 Tax=Cinchona calisaya TaxID=153742 RepID=A0ABD3AEB9_9GENT